MTQTPEPRIFDLHIQPTYAVHIPQATNRGRTKSALRIANEVNLKENKPKGVLSDKARRKLMNAVNWLIASSRRKWVYDKATNKRYSFRVNFITLTIPTLEHGISDHKFKSVLLHAFINACRYKYGLSNYVWKVETQKNGNIHAHFTTDCFIHWKDLRRTWNTILSKHGIIEAYKAKHQRMSFNDYMQEYGGNFENEASVYAAYRRGVNAGWSDPNTTDVKAVFKVKDIAGYIAKYLGKNDNERRLISGRLWSCSTSLSASNRLVVECPPNKNLDMFNELCKPEVDYKRIERQSAISGKVFTVGEIFFFKHGFWGKVLRGRLLEVFNDHCFKIRNSGTYQPHIEPSKIADIQPADYILHIPEPTKQPFLL